MTTQFAITEEYGKNSLKKLTIHDNEILIMEARIALDLITRWGLVVGKIDGEDSSGRAILNEMPTAEVVEKACNMADSAMSEFRKRGWTMAAPDISELLRKTDD